jgi:hypothetical protein
MGKWKGNKEEKVRSIYFHTTYGRSQEPLSSPSIIKATWFVLSYLV